MWIANCVRSSTSISLSSGHFLFVFILMKKHYHHFLLCLTVPIEESIQLGLDFLLLFVPDVDSITLMFSRIEEGYIELRNHQSFSVEKSNQERSSSAMQRMGRWTTMSLDLLQNPERANSHLFRNIYIC